MNKKYILCIFIVLVVITNSSYALPAGSKPVNDKLILIPLSGKSGTSNTPQSSIDDVNNLNVVGKLDIVRSNGDADCCTASVIKSKNGNIAITAAHCLYDFDAQRGVSEVYFSPGYKNGQPGAIGKLTAKSAYIHEAFTENTITADYGFIKLSYPDGRRLQDDAGAFDYDLNIPRNNYTVNVFGYPTDGEMDCARDGKWYCQYEGLSFDMPPDVPNPQLYKAIAIDVGTCSDGGPWVRIYNPATKAGNVCGVSHGILPKPYPDESAAWAWTSDEFTRLLNFAENN